MHGIHWTVCQQEWSWILDVDRAVSVERDFKLLLNSYASFLAFNISIEMLLDLPREQAINERILINY